MEYQIQENCLTVFMPKEVDHYSSEKIKQDADKLIQKKHIKHMIFDFKNTDFMDSSGIGVIMGRYRLLSIIGGEIWAVHVSERLKKTLLMSGVGKYIHVCEEEELR